MGRPMKKADAGPRTETDADKIKRLEGEVAQLADIVRRTAAFMHAKGAEIGTAGARLNKVLGL